MPAPRNSASPNLDEFEQSTHADWQAAAGALLPEGRTLESLVSETYEGLPLQPLYSSEHGANLQMQHSFPGSAPFIRGASAQVRPWLIVQASDRPDPRDAGKELNQAVKQGATAIEITPDRATLLCQHQIAEGRARETPGGTSLSTASDCAALLQGFSPEQTALFLRSGARSLPLPALLMAGLANSDLDHRALSGAAGADPLGWLATTGSLPAPLAALYDEQALWLTWCSIHARDLDAIILDGSVWHEAGANAVQELAFSLANATATLRALLARGLDVDTAAPRLSLAIPIGGDMLMELAKLRAARMLWSQMLNAFGAAPKGKGLTLHARTGRRNKSALDPWSNMLRSTFEALTAVMGGCDSLLVEPHDAPAGLAGERGRRLSRNQQLVLMHEAGLDRLQDPAGGSWTLESLTDWLAREAWSEFQRVEAQGGLLAALQAGDIQRAIGAVAQRRALRNASRQDLLTGSNAYSDGNEFVPRADGTLPYRDEPVPSAEADSPFPIALTLQDRDSARFEDLLKAARDGASLEQLAAALPVNGNEAITVVPLRSLRLAAPWEELRANASRHRDAGGQSARVYLALCGDAAKLHARASFVSDFFQVGGFECLGAAAWGQAEAAAEAACATSAPLAVLCARDSDYPALAGPFCQYVRAIRPEMLVYIAGRPDPAAESALRDAGVDDFVHLGSDCLAMNRALQRFAGIVS